MVLCLVLTLTACGVTTIADRIETKVEPEPTAIQDSGVTGEQLSDKLPDRAEKASGPAVIALMRRADTEQENGNLDYSASLLERAIRIEPKNPFLHLRLAQLRLEQGQQDQAEVLARKSNSLSGGNPYLLEKNWRVIAQSRQMNGDDSGAREASQRADRYRAAIK